MLEPRTKVGIIASVLVLVAAALMQHASLRIGGIAPNVLLVSLIVISFYVEQVFWYAGLVIVAAALVRTSPVFFDPVALTTIALALIVFFLQRRMVWPGLVAASLLTCGATIATYLCIEPYFIWQHTGVLIGELVYNVGISIIVFEVLRLLVGASSRR